MMKLKQVEARPGFKLFVVFDDGVEGEVDFSGLAGKGVFVSWNTPGFFETVHIGEAGQIAWSNEIDICADAVYLRLTGKTVEEVFSRQIPEKLHA